MKNITGMGCRLGVPALTAISLISSTQVYGLNGFNEVTEAGARGNSLVEIVNEGGTLVDTSVSKVLNEVYRPGIEGESKISLEVVDEEDLKEPVDPNIPEEDPVIFSAFVPAELPIKMDTEGNIHVSKDASIINGVERKGICVRNIDVELLNEWIPVAYNEDLRGEEIDSKKIGIMLRNDSLLEDGSFPINLEDWKIPKDSYIRLEMQANLPKQRLRNLEKIASIGFTLDWSGDDSSRGPAYNSIGADEENPDNPSEIVDPENLTAVQAEDEGWIYTDYEDGWKIIGYKNPKKRTIVQVPKKIEDKTVYVIGNTAFCDEELIEEITLPNTITDIEDGYYDFDMESYTEVEVGAFRNCISLEKVNLPERLKRIGNRAFDNCNGLIDIKLPSSLETIGECGFRNCSNLQDILLPEGITDIEEYAFQGCTKINNIKIPNSIKILNDGVFTWCKNLTNISISQEVTQIGACVFYQCENLRSVRLPEGVTSIGEHAFCDCYKLSNINIPEGVTRIEEGTFDDCTELESILLPEGVNYIGEQAFYRCYNIKSLNIPKNVMEIGKQAFTGVSLDIKIDEMLPEKFKDSMYYSGILAGWYGFPSEVEIPGTVEGIESNTFSQCFGLNRVVIQEGVQYIETYAFDLCRDLQILEIPISIRDIYPNAFRGCNDIKEIIIHGTLEEKNEVERTLEMISCIFPNANITRIE